VLDKNSKIVLDDSTSVLREEVPSDNYSKKKDNEDHEDDEPKAPHEPSRASQKPGSARLIIIKPSFEPS